MNLVELYEKIPVEQHNRIHLVGNDVFVRVPKNYFGDKTPEKVLHFGLDGAGNLFRISNEDIPDEVADKLDEWGIE